MKIYSYFQPVKDLNVDDEVRLSILWRRHWIVMGFEPVILTEWHARKHPDFKAFDAAISALPSCNPKEYERACYLRWMALAVVGGGFMADLDVFLNRGGWDGAHLPEDEGRLIVFQAPCCPSFVQCSKENAERLCLEFATSAIGNRPQGDRPHYSDQYGISDLVEHQKADWIQVRDVVKQYPDDGWRSAPLIHFPNASMAPRGKIPKWKHVPTLLE